MLKINLIPKSYFEKQLVRRLALFFMGLFALVLVSAVLAFLLINKQTAEASTELESLKPIAAQVKQLESDAAAQRAAVAPIGQRIKFIEDVMQHNVAMIPVLGELTKYTYEKITYVGVKPYGAAQGGGEGSGTEGTITSLEVQGWAPSITDAGRYVENLYRAGHLFNKVEFTGVPGYRTGSGGGGGGDQMSGVSQILQGAQLGFNFTMRGTLVKPITPPQFQGAGGGQPADQAGAAGAMPPGGVPGGAAEPPAPEDVQPGP